MPVEGEFAMNLIGGYEYIVPEADLADFQQVVACPYAAARIVGVAQQQQFRFGIGGGALQMKVIRPESFASVNQIADHLLSQRTVVLNLEATNKETARRLIDFLSGVAYSIDGSLKRIANNAYIITPSNVDVSGDQLREQRRAQQQQSSEDEGGYNY